MRSRRRYFSILFLVCCFSYGCDWGGTKVREELRAVNKAVARIGIPAGKSLRTRQNGNVVINRIELNYQDSSITDTHLAELSGLHGLIGIDLSDTQITDAGISVLSSLPDLEYIQLANTSITDRGLAEFKNFPSLKRLDLRGTKISADARTELSKCNTLTEVYSHGTGLVHGFGKVQVNSSEELRSYFRKKKGDGKRKGTQLIN